MLENIGAYQHMIFVIQNKQRDEYKPAMQAFLELVQAEPASVVDLAHMVLEHAPEGGTYFDTALSFLPMEDWSTVVKYALEALRRNMTNSEYPSCPVCGETQRFLLQLDDDLLTVDDQTGRISNWMWSGDSGMAYLFWCDACKVSSVRTQYV